MIRSTSTAGLQSPSAGGPPAAGKPGGKAPPAPTVRVVASAEPGRDAPSAEAAAVAALQLILKIERDARCVASTGELVFLIANETRKVVNARQVFVVRMAGPAKAEVVGISSLTTVDRTAPAVRWMERLVSRMAAEAGAGSKRVFTLPAYCDDTDPETRAYPFRELLWMPLVARGGKPFAGIVMARETPWIDTDLPVVARIAETFAHAWRALINPVGFSYGAILSQRRIFGAVAAIGLIALLPVPLTALAPAEVVPEAPAVVAAPIEGIIEEIVVAPNAEVKAGAVLFRFNDTSARNALEVAEREVQVAEAKLRQVTQAAFVDPAAKRELAIADAEFALKRAERDFARDVMQKSVVHASRDGLAVFGDKREFIGRPVTVGQRIMELADPRQVAFKINVPVEDAVVLDVGASVRVFLDADPLNPFGARVIRASHSARVGEANQLSFRVDAQPTEAGRALPRLGLRGTAQLYGPQVTLGFYLLRRPITYARQKLGL